MTEEGGTESGEYFFNLARRTGSDGNKSAYGSAFPGFDLQRGSKFSFENFEPRGYEGGHVNFLIARLYSTSQAWINSNPLRRHIVLLVAIRP